MGRGRGVKSNWDIVPIFSVFYFDRPPNLMTRLNDHLHGRDLVANEAHVTSSILHLCHQTLNIWRRKNLISSLKNILKHKQRCWKSIQEITFYYSDYDNISVYECLNSVLYYKSCHNIHSDMRQGLGSAWTQCGSSHWWKTCCCTGSRSHTHVLAQPHASLYTSWAGQGDLKTLVYPLTGTRLAISW